MSRIKDDNYIVISGWMINRLQLKGNELIVYAIIHGFTQDGENWFESSRQYLADFIGCSSKRTIDACIESLLNKGLLQKREQIKNGVKFCDYKAVCATGAEIAPGVVQKLHRGGGAEIAPHNKELDNNNIKNPHIPPKEPSQVIITELTQRINALFHRRSSTAWSVYEVRKLNEVAKRSDVLSECSEIEKLYNSDYQYRRRDISTFLNQWTTELDRARNYKPQQSKFDRTTREVDYDPGF